MQNLFKTAAEDNIKSIRSYVTELKERVAKLQYQKQLLVCQVLLYIFIYISSMPIVGAPVAFSSFPRIKLFFVCEVAVLDCLLFPDNTGART